MNYAVILSGGIGTRMRADGFPKQYIEVQGKPILIYTLEQFQACTEIDRIILVAAGQWQNDIDAWIKTYHITKVCEIAPPGGTRQESILNGLEKCMLSSADETDRVIIHDAVRPFVSQDLIVSCLSALDEFDGCMPVLPVNDTVYQSQNGNTISELLDRNTLFAGQSPEAFRLKKYFEINKNASAEELSMTRGSSEIAFRHGLNVRLISGEQMNFKLTTPDDLKQFEILLQRRGE